MDRERLEAWAGAVAGVGVRRIPARLPRGGRAGRRSCPPDRATIDTVLRVFILEKALYELRYELNHRPDWVSIPLSGILELLGR